MGFLLLRRDGDTVGLIAPHVFESRAEALAEISRLSQGEGIDADEILLVDIDAAIPVLIVPQAEDAQLSHAADEREARAAEETGHTTLTTAPTAPAGVIEVESAIAEAVFDGSEAPGTTAEVSQSIEEASDEPEVSVQELPIGEPAMPEEAPDDADAGVSEPAEPTASSPPHSWPWDAQVFAEESVEIEPVPAADEPALADQKDDAAETLPAETDSFTQEDEAIHGESVSDEEEPRPESEEMPYQVEPEAEALDSDEEPVADEVSGLAADLEELVPAVSVASASGSVASTTPSERISASLDPEPPLPEEPPKAYAAGGSDIAELTCEDCIYLNTCPKKDESDPSSCGSFQWKSV